MLFFTSFANNALEKFAHICTLFTLLANKALEKFAYIFTMFSMYEKRLNNEILRNTTVAKKIHTPLIEILKWGRFERAKPILKWLQVL